MFAERTGCARHSPRLVRPEVVVGAEEVDGELADRVRLLLDVLRDVPLVTDLAGPPPGDMRARDARTMSVGYHAPQGTTGQGITDLKPRRVPSTTDLKPRRVPSTTENYYITQSSDVRILIRTV